MARVFYVRSDPALGSELWVTDGIRNQLVQDINPGAGNADPKNLLDINGTVYFSATDGTHGQELWRSNGSAAGTRMVLNINPADPTGASLPTNLINVNGTVFFAANDGTHGQELWQSDGTTGGTQLVADINPGFFPSSPSQLTKVGNTLYFAANDGTHGTELWKWDGTSAQMVANLTEPSPIFGTTETNSDLSGLTDVNGRLFFIKSEMHHVGSVNFGTLVRSSQVWSSDGTAGGTVNLGAMANNVVNVNGTAYFADGTNLWRSDGTVAGTQIVEPLIASQLLNVNGALFFNASNPNQHSGSIGVTNGTPAGTSTFFVASNGFIDNLTNVNGTVFFEAVFEGDGGFAADWQLWRSDGTAAGTFMVKDIKFLSTPHQEVTSGFTIAHPELNLINANGTLFFTAFGDLWKSDGTPGGTVVVASNVNGSVGMVTDNAPWPSGAGNQAPVVATTDANPAHGQTSIAASSLFSVMDPDGDAITKYQFLDGVADPASGHFLVNGVTQAAGQIFEVTPADLAQTTFQPGSIADTLAVRAFDGFAFSEWKIVHVNPPPDQAPVVTVADINPLHTQTSLTAASLFSVTDAENDPIVKYQFIDAVADPASGHFVVNGVSQTASQVFEVTAAQLAQTSFQLGSVADVLAVRASDGVAFSEWKILHVNPPANQAPVVTTTNVSAAHLQSTLAASSLFNVTDPDNDLILKYQFVDGVPDAASGHFVVNGVTQGAGQIIDVSAAQLAQTTFQLGSIGDTLAVRAFDGVAFSQWKLLTVTPPPNQAPVVTVADITPLHTQTSLAAASLFGVTDPENDPIVKYQFIDAVADPASGHFVVSGVGQGAGQIIEVTAAQLAQSTFQLGAVGSPGDVLAVRAFDGFAFSDWKVFHVNAPPNQAPAVTVADITPAHGQTSLAASSLFSVIDPDSDAITKYQFVDGFGDPATGHFVVNGVTQGAGQIIDVTAAQLAQTTFQLGTMGDVVAVRAFDGFAFSDWKIFHVNAPPNQAPVVTVADITPAHGQTSLAASSLFGVTDPENDSITKYQFVDAFGDPATGHFVVNGVTQPAGQVIDVAAADLAQTAFQLGTVGDVVAVRASDGFAFSDWKILHVNAPADQAPVVGSGNIMAPANTNVAANTLFSVSDADNDPMVAFQFFDATSDPSSGHFVVNGVGEPANQIIDVLASQLGQASFLTGSVPGMDHIGVRAFDGQLWSDWHMLTI